MLIPTAVVQAAGGAMTLIEDKLLDADAANFDFTAIVGTYKHLLLIIDARGTSVATTVTCNLTFNGDGGTNYDYNLMFSVGAAPTQIDAEAATAMLLGDVAAANAPAGRSGGIRSYIPSYAGTTFNKNVLSQCAVARGTTTTDVITESNMGVWRSTAAITQITLTPSAGNWLAGSRATLYGLN